MKKIIAFIKRIIGVLSDIARRRVGTYAAAGAFYLFLALVPMMILLCSLLPITQLSESVVLETISNVVPNSMFALVEYIIRSIYDASAATLSISIVVTVWSASFSMAALMRGMDAAYGVERRESFVVFYLRACIYMLIFMAVMLISLCVMVYGHKILDLVEAALPDERLTNLVIFVVRYGRYLVVPAFLAVVFALLYKWMPYKKLKLREQWSGAIFTAVMWLLFSSAFSFYVSFANAYGIYGILGTMIIAMLWMYYCLYILLIGAFINSSGGFGVIRAPKSETQE